MSSEAERIAAGLSEAQSQTLLRAKANNKCDGYHLPQHRDGGRMKHSLFNLGLCSITGRITVLGLAVRKVLETDNAQHGSNTTKAKQRACANALGDFLSWLRETAK